MFIVAIIASAALCQSDHGVVEKVMRFFPLRMAAIRVLACAAQLQHMECV